MHQILPITRTATPCAVPVVRATNLASAAPSTDDDRYSVVSKAPTRLLRPVCAPAGIVEPSSAETNAPRVPAPTFTRAPHPSSLEAAADSIYSRLAGLVGYVELLGVHFPLHQPYKANLPAVDFTGRVARDIHGRVIPSGITRGSHISDDDIQWLAAHRYKGVLSLTAEGGSHEQDVARAAGMSAERIAILDNHPPTLAELKRALDFMNAHKPVYVHCAAGVGRTGTIIAAYRIAVEGCTVQQALAETAQYGKLIPWQRDFIRELPARLAHGELPGYQLHGNAAREYVLGKE